MSLRAKGGRGPRVLLLMHELSATGAPRVALSVFRMLTSDLEVRVLADRGGPLAEDFRAVGRVNVLRNAAPIDVLSRLVRDPRVLDIARGAWSRLRSRSILLHPLQWQPDVIYVNSVVALSILARMPWVRRLGRPVILHVHEGPVALADHDMRAPGIMTRLPDHYIVVSQHAADALVDRFGVDRDRISVVPPHVDDFWIRAGEAAPTSRQAPRDGPITLGGIGSPTWTKGPELWLLIAAELVRRHGPDRYRFLWVGAREDEAAMRFRTMVTKLGLDDAVRVRPETQSPLPIYQQMDILIVSSWEESASLTTLEFMALGKPVACFAGSGGPAELLGDAGLIVPEFSPASMADAIDQLDITPERRRELGAAGRTRVLQRFTADQAVPRILGQIRDVQMAGRNRSHAPNPEASG